MIFDMKEVYRGVVKGFKYSEDIEIHLVFRDPDRQKITLPARPSSMAAVSMKMNLPASNVRVELLNPMDRATVEHAFLAAYSDGALKKWDDLDENREFHLKIKAGFTGDLWEAIPDIKGNEYVIRITELQGELDFDKKPPSQCIDCGEATEYLDDAGRCDECKAAYPEEKEEIQAPETAASEPATNEPYTSPSVEAWKRGAEKLAANDLEKHAKKRMNGSKTKKRGRPRKAKKGDDV